MRKIPEYFLLGAPKCGTTALASYLSDHPMIYVSIPKETHYFCKDLKAGQLPVKSDEEYVNTFFPGLAESHVLAAIDCSVWNMYSQVAVEEILRFCPNAKFLVMLRNPVKMAWSWFSQLTFQGLEDQNNFMSAWDLQADRRLGKQIPKDIWCDNKMLLYKDVCSLGSQMYKVLNIIDRERIHIELQDDLLQDSRRVYLRVLDFMGIPDDGRNSFLKTNAGRKLSNTVLYSILRSSIVKKSAITIKQIFNLKTLGFGRPDLHMTNELKTFLTCQFEEEIAIIENLLRRDLRHWRFR